MQRPRSSRPRRLWRCAGLALLLPPTVQAAAYLPGTTSEADPPTGDTSVPSAARAAAPAGNGNGNGNGVAGNGIRWYLAPWRSEGSITFDARWLRLDDGARSRQGVVFGEIDWSSYVWEPWFIQLRAGLGLLAVRDNTKGEGGPSNTSNSGAVTGRFTVAVFPASRFPFELRADVSDSRTRGDNLGTDYQATRLSLNQAWRPETGNDNVALHVDYSRLSADTVGTDTLMTINATATRLATPHMFELTTNYSLNERTDNDNRNELSYLTGRYSYTPRANVVFDTLASWNEASLGSVENQFTSSVRQITSFGTWRPASGEPLYVEGSPLYVSGSARWVESATGDAIGQRTARAFNMTLGANQDVSRDWRISGNLAGGRFDRGSGDSTMTANANAAATWTPVPYPVGDWRWGPSVSGALGLAETTSEGRRNLQGLQGTHTFSRDWPLNQSESVAFTFSQSAAVLNESTIDELTRSFANSMTVYWQSSSGTGRQSFVGMSLIDSRNWGETTGSFQLVNLQWNQRVQFSRYSSGNADITAQATKNESTVVDAFTGARREERGGWQQTYTLSANYEHQRAFDVPRLRFTLQLAANSQQLERRAFGDIEAPRERISQSLEGRLDYNIGRLEARLLARAAKVEETVVGILVARLQRRF